MLGFKTILLNGANEWLPIPESMYTGLLHGHSGLRYLLLIALVTAVVTAFRNVGKGNAYAGVAKRFGLITMILTDIQLLIGLVLWYVNIDTRTNFKINQLKDAMADSTSRYFIVEHFIMMILAVLCIHLGYRMAKKSITGVAANKAQFRWYLIALILMLVAIPWPFYGNLGRDWF